MMQLWSESFEPGGPIPETFAFGRRDAEGRIALAGNRSPHLGGQASPQARARSRSSATTPTCRAVQTT